MKKIIVAMGVMAVIIAISGIIAMSMVSADVMPGTLQGDWIMPGTIDKARFDEMTSGFMDIMGQRPMAPKGFQTFNITGTLQTNTTGGTAFLPVGGTPIEVRVEGNTTIMHVPDPAHPRINLIVLNGTLNTSGMPNSTVELINGTPSEFPVPPYDQIDPTEYMPLAEVFIYAGATKINQTDIINLNVGGKLPMPAFAEDLPKSEQTRPDDIDDDSINNTESTVANLTIFTPRSSVLIITYSGRVNDSNGNMSFGEKVYVNITVDGASVPPTNLLFAANISNNQSIVKTIHLQNTITGYTDVRPGSYNINITARTTEPEAHVGMEDQTLWVLAMPTSAGELMPPM